MTQVKITIPTKLSEIKLSQYQKFARTTKDSEDDKFIARQIVGIFCDIPDTVVGQIKAKDFESIVTDITNVLSIKPEFKTKFVLDGVKYGFIPDLEDITVDEKADLDTYLSDMDKMDKAMAVMYRPIIAENKRGYLIEEYMEEINHIEDLIEIEKTKINSSKLVNLRINLIDAKKRFEEKNSLDVSLDIAFGANFFLHNLMSELLSFIQNYISDQVEHSPKLSQTLEANGVGTIHFIKSLEEAFSHLKRLVNLDYTKH